jgi:hypothetical protein
VLLQAEVGELMYPDTDYERIVTDLTCHPVIIDMVIGLPVGFPISDLFTPDGEQVVAAEGDRFNLVFDLANRQRGIPPGTRPYGAVVEAVRRVAAEMGITQ